MRSKDPDATLPPVDKTLRRITEPDPELVNQNRLVFEEFHRSFELKDNPKVIFTHSSHCNSIFLVLYLFAVVFSLLNFTAEKIISKNNKGETFWI